MKELFFLIIVVFTSNEIVALSTKNITLYENDSSSVFVRVIRQVDSIEQLCTYWTPEWNYTIPRDSVKAILFNALEQINRSVETINIFYTTLLRGLLWHYLYQVEVDSAFVKANAIADGLRKMYPERIEGTWLKGINLVKASRLIAGFKYLDSLRTFNKTISEDFFTDYRKLSVLAFLPDKIHYLGSDVFFQTSSKNNNTYLNVSERRPFSKKWEVVSSPNSKKVFPSFIFGADFSVKKPFSLPLPALRKEKKFQISIKVKKEIEQDIQYPLLYDPDADPFTMEMKIFVENKDDKVSLYNYVLDLVYKEYDEIRQVKTLHGGKVFVLKCFNKSAVRGGADKYTSIVAFDRIMNTKSSLFYYSNNKNKEGAIVPLRYLIAMKTKKEVEVKADVLFQEVLDKFNIIMK